VILRWFQLPQLLLVPLLLLHSTHVVFLLQGLHTLKSFQLLLDHIYITLLLLLLLLLLLCLLPPLCSALQVYTLKNVLHFYISTVRSMCAVPNVTVCL
jgi:hypothetical protein